MDKFSIKEFFSTIKKFFLTSLSSFKDTILTEKKRNKRYFYLIIVALLILVVNITLITSYNLSNSNKEKQQLATIKKNLVLPDEAFIAKITSLNIGKFSDPVTTAYSWQYLAMTSGGYNQPLMSATITKSVYVQNVIISNWQELLTKKIYDEGYSDDSMNGGFANLAFSNGKFFVKVDKVAKNNLIIYFGVLPALQ